MGYARGEGCARERASAYSCSESNGGFSTFFTTPRRNFLMEVRHRAKHREVESLPDVHARRSQPLEHLGCAHRTALQLFYVKSLSGSDRHPDAGAGAAAGLRNMWRCLPAIGPIASSMKCWLKH